MVSNPSIAQLVERRTVDDMLAILRSLVQIRLEGGLVLNLAFTFSFSSDFVSPDKKRP